MQTGKRLLSLKPLADGAGHTSR